MPITAAFASQPFFTAAWVWDETAGAYVNNTLEARSAVGTAFTIFEDVDDYLYLGSESRFDLGAFLLSVNGTLGPLDWEYYNGTAWVQFMPGFAYDFTSDGAEVFTGLGNWTSLAFSATVPHMATPPDTRERYWIRVSATSITTSPQVNQIRARPLASYCRPTDVANLLQLTSDFSSTTSPTDQTVEEFISSADSYIDTTTDRSWRINWAQEEYHNFELAGFKLHKGRAFHTTKLEIWNGSSFEVKSPGRDRDFFIVPDNDFIYWSRFFLLPAKFSSRFSNFGRSGEYAFPVRVSYFFGENLFENATQGRTVWDISRKLAAIDVFQSHDYSILAVSGSDKVSLETKIRNWREEVTEKIDSLGRWQVF